MYLYIEMRQIRDDRRDLPLAGRYRDRTPPSLVAPSLGPTGPPPRSLAPSRSTNKGSLAEHFKTTLALVRCGAAYCCLWHDQLFALAALAMGLIGKLTARYGRAPTADEIADARARRDAKKASALPPQAVPQPAAPAPQRIKLEIVRSRLDVQPATESNPEPKGTLVELGGVGSKANLLVNLVSNVPDKTVADVRAVAANAFGAANGWQIYLGKNTIEVVFIGGADGGAKSFKEEFEILIMDGITTPKAFAVECLKGTEGVRSAQPMQQPMGAVVKASGEALAEAVDGVFEGLSKAAKIHSARAAGAHAVPSEA